VFSAVDFALLLFGQSAVDQRRNQRSRNFKMTSESRLLLGEIAKKLEHSELIAAVFLCRDIVPQPDLLNNVKTAFELMNVLEQQKVIDVDKNDWRRLDELLRSNVVKRKDLAERVSKFGECRLSNGGC